MNDEMLRRMRYWLRVRSRGAVVGARILARAVRMASLLVWPIRANLIAQAGQNLKYAQPVRGKKTSFDVICLNNAMVERARLTPRKESDTCSWIDNIPAGSVFWDIGANIGIFTLYAASRDDLDIVSFEPHPGNYYSLCNSVIANGYSKRCAVYPLALYERAFLGRFNYHSVEIGSAMNVFDKTTDNEGKDFIPAASMATMGITVDEFVLKWGAPSPEYIKLDVDGNELSILKGAQQTLVQSVREVYVETAENYAESSTQIDELLKNTGFEEAGRARLDDNVQNRRYIRRGMTEYNLKAGHHSTILTS
ncbi:FkbM family methyltransferase [Radicibacter daui]|uniref:FkbM family methyltransferase n=1 Tax=Radicibacter daui TaxID=3064829 RepID=UPI004046D28F